MTVRARRLAAWLTGAACSTAWALTPPQPAATPAPTPAPAAARPDEPTHWYVVQPGDNLHVIAGRVLGDRLRWPRLWRLNPEIKDPNVLRPGARIRVPGAAGESATAEIDLGPPPSVIAELSRLSQRVEEQPHPQPVWAPARAGDRLKERDGLRTHEKASAELTFDDGTRYQVTERSLLFLRAPSPSAAARRARALEVVAGQADVEIKPATRGAREIEIIVGASHSRARPAADENGQARARRAGSGASQLMVYRGAGEMNARGVKVDVPRGMGTSAQPGAAPAPPETLLPAPLSIGPAEGAAFDHANPIFSWAPVPGAASYTVEVCADAACGELIDRATDVAGVRWTVDGLPLGGFYWRVTAVSVSGLDGYASAPVPFSVRGLWRRPLTP